VDTIETFIDGTLANHSIFLRSGDLNPDTKSENYSVTSTVAMRNSNGIFEDFTTTTLGVLTVNSLGTPEGSAASGGTGSAGPYDLIVETAKNRYEEDSIVDADITIFNTGDLPDDDVILDYWLTDPDGVIFGLVSEQFKEPVIGQTVKKVSIQLPTGAQLGEWRFNAHLFTTKQVIPTRFDSFEVIEKIPVQEKIVTFLKKIVNSIKVTDTQTLLISSGLISTLILFALFIKRKKY